MTYLSPNQINSHNWASKAKREFRKNQVEIARLIEKEFIALVREKELVEWNGCPAGPDVGGKAEGLVLALEIIANNSDSDELNEIHRHCYDLWQVEIVLTSLYS